MSKKEMINSVGLAMGTASYCKSCRALLAFGVNSAEAMRAVGVPSQAWIGWLIGHERYHKSKGEELPVEWTVAGLTQEFKDNVLSPKPRLAKPLTDEEKAILAFNRLAGKGNQSNGRRQPPVMRPLDTRAFGSFK